MQKKNRFKLSFKKYLLLLSGIVLILLISFFLYRIWVVKAPVITGQEALMKLPRHKVIQLEVDCNFPVKSFEIIIIQDEKQITLLNDRPEQRHKLYKIKIDPKKIGLNDGDAMFIINASAGFFSKLEYKLDTVIDTVPPVTSVLNNSYLAHQGSAAAALIKATGAEFVYVRIGEEKYYATNSVTGNNELYYVLFPIGVETEVNSIIHAVAEDMTGNRSVSTITTRIKKTEFNKDIIEIKDPFIKKKIYPLINDDEAELPPLDAFLLVNEKLRNKTEEKLKELTKKSVDKMLWEDRFIQMRNTKVFSNFADKRSYKYNGKVVSHSRHMGFDLASTKNAPVEAANSGIIIFADYLGIYGNTVIIDHGLGLMSMYSHLSSIDVKEGDEVIKTDVIGRSGMTGLAGGDHLHFAILLHGVYVSPLGWWDISWIEKRILNILHNI